MSWTKHQIITLQQYRRHARLPDCDYRGILKEVSGAFSSKDAGLTNWHFDQVMARVEARLEYRIHEGFVPAPAGIRLDYWRRRLPQGGEPNSRQWHRIWHLWDALREHLPPEQQTTDYLAAIAARACGYHVQDVHAIRAWQAGLLVDALRDRLHYALVRADRPDVEDGLSDAVIPRPVPGAAHGSVPGAAPAPGLPAAPAPGLHSGPRVLPLPALEDVPF
jgi:hypothetical protein